VENSCAWHSRFIYSSPRKLQSPKNTLIFSSNGEMRGKNQKNQSTRTVKVFVSNDKILDDGLRGD